MVDVVPRPNPTRALHAEENLARRIAHEREQRGWTYEGLATRLTEAGCPIQGSAIYKIEKGAPRRRISVDELVALSKVFDVDIADLLISVEIIQGVSVTEWLETNPGEALEAAAAAAERQIPGHLGVCVSAVLFDHGRDHEPDPNIHELAHTLLANERQLTSVPRPFRLSS